MQVLISKEPTVAGRVAAHVAGLEDELGLLRQLDHPNIVRYLVRPPPHTPYPLLLLANGSPCPSSCYSICEMTMAQRPTWVFADIDALEQKQILCGHALCPGMCVCVRTLQPRVCNVCSKAVQASCICLHRFDIINLLISDLVTL